jgi:hypothetical protein
MSIRLKHHEQVDVSISVVVQAYAGSETLLVTIAGA